MVEFRNQADTSTTASINCENGTGWFNTTLAVAGGSLSSIHGKGTKQSDDIVRGYTVAKSRESVTFNNPNEVKQIACIYLCR